MERVHNSHVAGMPMPDMVIDKTLDESPSLSVWSAEEVTVFVAALSCQIECDRPFLMT